MFEGRRPATPAVGVARLPCRSGQDRFVAPRGEVGLIFASIGHTVLVAGTLVLGDATFSAIIAMVMLTTLVTPPLLKAAFLKSSAHPSHHGMG